MHRSRENNTMGNIRDIKGTFYARMGTIKDGNGKDLTETDEI